MVFLVIDTIKKRGIVLLPDVIEFDIVGAVDETI